MRLLSYDGKRFVLGICLLLLVFSAANRFLEWGLFGWLDRPLPGLVVLLVIALMTFWGEEMREKGRQRLAAKQAAEAEHERQRDKTHDAEDLARLRRDIGLPPNISLERTRER